MHWRPAIGVLLKHTRLCSLHQRDLTDSKMRFLDAIKLGRVPRDKVLLDSSVIVV